MVATYPMKLKYQDVDKTGRGSVKLELEEPDDVWCLYNLVEYGDEIFSCVKRRFDELGQLSVHHYRASCMAKISVSKISFEGTSEPSIRLSGKIIGCDEHKALKGTHQTIPLQVGSSLTLTKSEWDTIHWRILRQAVDSKQSAEVAVVLIDAGHCEIYHLTEYTVKEVFHLKMDIPKRQRGDKFKHAETTFFDTVAKAMMNNINLSITKCVLVAGPGFTKNDFWKWAQGNDSMAGFLKGQKDKFLICNTSSAYKQAINEIMLNPTLAKQVTHTKVAKQVEAFSKFQETLANNPQRACYGESYVIHAVEQGAVETLLITNSIIRSEDVNKRRRMVELVKSVEADGGTVLLFSDEHSSSEQLNLMTGIAALLRYDVVDPTEKKD